MRALVSPVLLLLLCALLHAMSMTAAADTLSPAAISTGAAPATTAIVTTGANVTTGDNHALNTHPDIDSRLDTLFGSHVRYQKFLAELQALIAAKDWPGVAKTLAYPMKIKRAGHSIRLRSPEDFLRRSGSILTPRVQAAILNQTYASLFANADGVMIGDGAVWFSGICKDAQCIDPALKITAINP